MNPPLPKDPAGIAVWLQAVMPRDGDPIDVALARVGEAYATVLGASLDLLCELRAERERLRNGVDMLERAIRNAGPQP